MICPKCGQETADNSKYCSHCGAMLGESGEIEENEYRKEMNNCRFLLVPLFFLVVTACLFAFRGPILRKCADFFYARADYGRAGSCYRLASNCNDGEAQYALAQMMESGLAGTGDDAEIAMLYQRAADDGQPQAMYEIGKIYLADGDYAHAREILEQASLKGETRADYYLGVMYAEGRDVEPDDVRALTYLRSASDNGFSLAQYYLGRLYMEKDSEVTGYDPEMGKKWLRASAEGGSSKAALSLADAYYGEQDYRNAMEWYLNASDMGENDARKALGDMYFYGYGTKTDCVKAADRYKEAVDGGYEGEIPEYEQMRGLGYGQSDYFVKAYNDEDPEAQNSLANEMSGRGDERSAAAARYWWEKAAAQGQSEAMYHLGMLCFDGTDCDQDYAAALKWFHGAAAGGNTESAAMLGIMYEQGLGCEQDYEAAIVWYRTAADQDDADSAAALGYLYSSGLDCVQDYEKALELFDRAAELGSAAGAYNAGVLRYNGSGCAVDYHGAYRCYEKAAAQGYASAEYQLGRMCAEGIGCAKDEDKAVRYFISARDHGSALASYEIGLIYRGRGKTEKARRAFLEAVEAKDYRAYYCLGDISFESGEYEAAYNFFMHAYSLTEDPEAAFRLAEIYYNGQGRDRSPYLAKIHYQLAADAGHKGATEALIEKDFED